MATVDAHITGTVWKIEVTVGDVIEEGDVVAILESMKMEMPVEAEEGGTVAEILCEEGQSVEEGRPRPARLRFRRASSARRLLNAASPTQRR